MSTNKLYLFSKDTGATATEQGYHYQKLKTLKTWLENRIAKVEEVIYCNYEDDIFQRNFNAGTSKFRQIKLYSSNFSFSTEEITKSITNFFMLFTKGDYLYDDAQFVFETNSSIAREIRGNDANLLKEWNENQGNMSGDLVTRCATRVKAIVDTYVKEGYAKQMAGDTTGDFLKAKNYYEQLPDEFWEAFIKSIRWQFESVQQNEAIPKLLEEIEVLIAQLPLPIEVKSASTYLAVLHYEIATRTAEPDEQERMLTNELLDVVILNKGSERDKWYAEVFQKWSAVAAINIFTVGSFYEVIDAARYCRWNLPRSEHSEVWLRLLKMYIHLPETIVLCKRKAIYEYLFLKMSPDMTTGRPGGSIENEVDLIKFYFENFQERNSLADIEDDITLLQIVFTQWMKTQDFIDPELITQWRTIIEDYIEERLVSPRDVDEQCQLYDLKGSTILHFNVGRDKAGKVNEALNVYRQIIPLLGETKLYTISRLSDLLKQMIDVYIQFGIQNDEVVDAIEEFLSEIAEKAVQTGNQHNQAHEFVERGVKYLKQGGAKNFLRALDCFQKSAKLWLLNDTKDGYILAMINIAQLYSALDANLAGKYYALCGIWSSFNFGDADSFKRIPDSYAMVFHADFKQGAWMSALGDFLNFINTRQQFDPQKISTVDTVKRVKQSVFLLSEQTFGI
ncbi:dsDNA nuclease domain-containing protein [Pedobacter sp. MR22-3]|uniref:dsDNA nuclease domain-containing protein n=1 Tax=Pedobacter sp. MR22-3 TaxID=2994552 RepID=UPI002245177E|nr:dsDNA nuclease domain-containing protein [Pedobacter sp. MR22-3]MCX2585666.1 dsDNA nuclease domain-containing protein [Pedobacter sp. MR22-3]